MNAHHLALALAATALTACGPKTPPCDDAAVTAKVAQITVNEIEAAVLRNDRSAQTEKITSGLGIHLENITTTDYDKSIGKFTCTANLHIALPAAISELKDHRAFRAYTQTFADVPIEGNDLVAPLTFTSYLSDTDGGLIVTTEGEKLPARFFQGAHKAGAFEADLNLLPDLLGGSTRYKSGEKNLLLRPNENGGLEFHMSFGNRICRPWTQIFTGEQGSTLVYDNPSVECSVLFSFLGELLLVEHEGCKLMVEACYPDGIYQKQ